MDHDHLAVAGELHVELDHVGAERFGPPEGGKRVLRRRPAGATVSDHERRHAPALGCATGAVKSELTRVQQTRKPSGVSSAAQDDSVDDSVDGSVDVSVGATPAWTAVTVEVEPSLAEAVTNFLFELGAAGVLTEESASGGARLEGAFHATEQARVAEALERYLASLGGSGSIHTAPVAPVDWTEIFRRHHRPVTIGHRLLVAPPWDVPAAPGREVLVIEPGMAFGTGQHETTRGCLEAIETTVATKRVTSALDVGTGSGILALALARLGVARVVAVDVDRAVLPLARANLIANRAPAVHLVAGTTAAVRGRFDLVVANLLAKTVVDEAPALARVVAIAGHLVLSGILEEQVPDVLAAYPGWRVDTSRGDGEWRTLGLVRGF
jgi:ribosomal protein L11 methyltransferase